MKINKSQNLYFEETKRVSINRDFGEGVQLYADISFLSEKFVEYQKDLFNEFLADVIDNLTSQEENHLGKFKNYFEQKLQDINSKLNIFAEKIKDVDNIPVRGIIQIFYNETYLASMIGDVSIVIFRDNQLSFVSTNELQDGQKIDTFSDLIEGELENGDQIMTFGTNIQNILEEQDIKDTLQISIDEGRELTQVFEDVLLTRVKTDDIVYITFVDVKFDLLFTKDTITDKFKPKKNYLVLIGKFFKKNRYPIVISIVVLFVLGLLYTMINNFINNDSKEVLNYEQGTLIVNITPTDLKKEIDLFKKISATSEEKSIKYAEIMSGLNLLEEKAKWPGEIKELREVLNDAYYKGFNIASITQEHLKVNTILTFTEDEKIKLGNILGLDRGNKLFYIGGEEGSIIGASDENRRGSILSYNIPNKMNGCSLDLNETGIYCYDEKSNIYNISKNGLKSVSSTSGKFPSDISGLGKYKKSAFYTFDNDGISENGSFITKYTNIIGSITKFSQGTEYQLDKTFYDNNKSVFASGFVGTVVDGTFLSWSKSDKNLYQFWRNPNSNLKMFGRKVNLLGGEKSIDPYSEDVKIITEADTKYVYLFDKINKTLTVYNSQPYKTNTAKTTEYNLRYYFRIKFDKDIEVKDIYIDSTGTKHVGYVLGKRGLYKLPIYEYFTSFEQQQ